MNKLTAGFIFLWALAFSLPTFAADAPDRGRWLCNDCALAPPQTAMSAADLASSWDFIKDTVNTVSNQTSWKQGEKVTICDGASCITLGFQALACACWMPMGPTAKDSGKGYKNAQIDKNPPPKNSGDHEPSIWRVFLNFFKFAPASNGVMVPAPKVGNVDIKQLSSVSDFGGLSTALGSGFDSGFGSSFSFGGDFAYGGQEAEAANGYGAGAPCRSGCNYNVLEH